MNYIKTYLGVSVFFQLSFKIKSLQRIIFFLIVFLILEILFFSLGIKLLKLNRMLILAIAVCSVISYIYFGWQIYLYDRSVGPSHNFYWAMGALILFLVPKLVVIVVGLMLWLLSVPISWGAKESVVLERRAFIGKLSLGIAAIPFLGILHGIFKGKYNFRVLSKTLLFKDLPKAFDGLKIVQISDLHSGSFDNEEKIAYAIDLINEQEADLFLFTGDIVNTKASEFDPWIDIFKNIKSFPLGKYSVLGNHDYGEYVTWPSEKEKQDNFEAIKQLHREVGFNLLLNQNVTLEKEGEQIKLIGVENWGKNFKKAGDLQLASRGVSVTDFKILMSHDPSHWEYEIKDNPKNYHLTLGGHTHGLQFGIEIPGYIKWSPIQYVYKQWAGLYVHLDRYIYVNRGFGFHAFPGRVGIWPEITVLELKRKL